MEQIKLSDIDGDYICLRMKVEKYVFDRWFLRKEDDHGVEYWIEVTRRDVEDNAR